MTACTRKEDPLRTEPHQIGVAYEGDHLLRSFYWVLRCNGHPAAAAWEAAQELRAGVAQIERDMASGINDHDPFPCGPGWLCGPTTGIWAQKHDIVLTGHKFTFGIPRET
jgi:hypothetical protein